LNCPTGCTTPLVMAERKDVEIDYCPTCRGVWLDRGELDKIIGRASDQMTPPAPAPAPAPAPVAGMPPPPPQHTPNHWDNDDYRYYQSRGYGKKRKKRSFLEDMFDFD
jgi:uncharacterized protein